MGPGFASTYGRVEPLLPVGEPLILAEAIEPAEATASVATGNDEELPDHGYFLFLFFVGVRSVVGAPRQKDQVRRRARQNVSDLHNSGTRLLP
jgi:hypothetical protein